MGSTNQIIVFVFFGEQFVEQFKVCSKTMPAYWNVKVITDVQFSIPMPISECIVVPTPSTVFDMLTFRKRINEFINIKKYDRVWYSDPDILFKGDILEKYSNSNDILLAYEPNTSLKHPCMCGGFSEEELQKLESINAPAINGGFYSVPKKKYDFFRQYKDLCNFFESKWANNKSTDQYILNNLYHRKLNEFILFTSDDVKYHPQEKDGVFGMVNHYIGMGMEKIELMRTELKRLQNDL